MIPVRPVPRISSIVHRAPGGAPVGMNYVRMMAAASARGTGANGTRGLYSAVVGQGPGVRVVPLIQTPAQGVLVSARSMWMPGTTKVGPRGTQQPALAGLGSGAWDNEAAAKAAMGKPLQPGEFYSNASPYPLWDGTTYQHKRACELGQKGMESACSRFGTPFGKASGLTSGPSGAEGSTLTTIKDVLSQFEARLRAGTIDPDTSFPTGTDPIAPLADEANRSLYNDVTTLHDTLIPGARSVGRMYRSLNSPVTPATTTTTSTEATSTTSSGSGTSSSVYDDPYNTSLVNDLYGGSVDPITGTVSSPSASPGTLTTTPAAAPSIASKRPVSGAAIAIGLVAVLGGAYAFSRRKGKGKSRSRSRR